MRNSNNKQAVVKHCSTSRNIATNQLATTSILILSLMLSANVFAKTNKIAAVKTPTVEIQSAGSCMGELTSPTKLDLPLGKSTLVKLPEPLASRTVGNPSIVQAKMISPQTLYLVGVDLGSTNMIIQGKSGTCTIIDVVVKMDPDGLQQALNELLPEEKNVKVSAAADALVLSGSVEDASTLNRVIDIASAFVRRKVTHVDLGENGSKSDVSSKTTTETETVSEGMVSPRIVNMLSVSAQQQVMLEVKIAEVSKSLLDKLGASVNFSKTNGNFTYSLITRFLSTLTGTSGGVAGAAKAGGNGFNIDAEKKDGLVKVLAEPTVMAISGQEGSFLAGGKIFIPVSQTNQNGIPTITLEEKEFGVGLKFTPTVLSGGRINMKVSPEVSELDKNGIGITAAGITGTAILPSFTTRRASTTVQLMDGQTFAIGGLIKNNTTANIKAFPILGEIPIIGTLFRSTEFQKDKTELIFIVTPHLVKPLPANGYQLPTDNYTDPSRTDIFLNGKLEGSVPPKLPAPAKQEEATVKSMNKPEEPAQTESGGFDVK